MSTPPSIIPLPTLSLAMLALWAGLTPSLAWAESDETDIANSALTLYGGRLGDGDWQESFGPGTHFIDSDLLVAAYGKTLSRSADQGRSYEVEGQIAKHSGIQNHWEYNLLGAVRWHRLPWSRYLKSSAAAGLGVSYASSLPVAEATIINQDSEQWLAYWHMELTLGPQRQPWQASLRLHHRSTAYGLFGDQGGANAVTLGVRYELD
jgi:hypothetical protein